MILSLAVLVFGCVVSGLLYRFRLRKAYTRWQVRALILPFLLISLLLALNGLATYLGRPKLARYVDEPMVSSVEELRQAIPGSEVLVRGIVSPSNPPLKGEYRAYIECQDRSCTNHYPVDGLLVDVDGGTILISNSDFSPLAWKEKANPPITYRYLESGGPVVVLGRLESLVSLEVGEQPSTGNPPAANLKADVLFSGAREGFRAQAQRSAVLPRLLLVTNLAAAVVIAILPITHWPEYG